jgi:hypothetical protein
MSKRNFGVAADGGDAEAATGSFDEAGEDGEVKVLAALRLGQVGPHRRSPAPLRFSPGGGDGTRTHDFFDATEALFQLSYTPKRDDSG